MARARIPLESGTNEVEVLEFIVGGRSFGVNVLLIQAIEQYDPRRVTRRRPSHPSVFGTLRFRDHSLTMVDLGRELGTGDRADDPGFDAGQPDSDEGATAKLVLVMEIDQVKTAFLIHGVNRIHRVSRESIISTGPYPGPSAGRFTGSLRIEGREILLVDMEEIVTGILPRWQFQPADEQMTDVDLAQQRAARTILLAEASAVLRRRVAEELRRAGYTSLRTFADGRECRDELARLAAEADAAGRTVGESVAALISGIEMPAMDGLALCRWVRQNRQTRDMPVIMFSPLVNDRIVGNCRAVGADACIGKPRFVELVNLLDQHTGLLEQHMGLLEPAGV